MACAISARADYDPIPLTQSSFNFDIVVEAGPAKPLPYSITASVGGGTGKGDSTFYEQGVRLNHLNYGLPHPGQIFTNESTSAIRYQMAPSYTANNTMLIDNGVTTGTWTLTTPATYTNLSFVGTGGGGSTTVGVVVTHQDNSVDTGSIVFADWFNNPSPALTVGGRIGTSSTGGGGFGDYGNNPRLYYQNLAVSSASPIVKIDFAYTSGAHANIFAISGNSSGAKWDPITVTGYNQDTIHELGRPVTATMDQGTNMADNGNLATWYEQGYVTGSPNTGLPHAGVVFSSVSLPDHHYVFNSFNANNAVLIDANHLVANITPQNPAPYTAFSLLTAGGNVGGGIMTNIIILQHEDGTSETNLFYGYDWYNNRPPAYISNGRVNMYDETVNTVNGGNPKLFESQFGLQNAGSPVTNIVLKYSTSPSPNSTTYVMAVSATSGGVAPVISVPPQWQNAFIGSSASFGVTLSAGTAPLSYKWQRTDSTNNPMADVPGGTNPTLTLNNISAGDAGLYQVIVTNAFGATTSSPALLTKLTALPDVTLPGDPITSFGGTWNSFYNEGPTSAINNTIQKMYLNGTAPSPFPTPIGIIVTPSQGLSTVSGLRFYTANDASDRDPVDFTLEGSLDNGASFSTITTGPLAFPDGRNGGGVTNAISPTNQYVAEALFANSTAYTTYRLSFSNVKGGTNTTGVQFAEVEFLGVVSHVTPTIYQQPPATHNVYVGGTLALTAIAHGAPTLNYQWYVNSSPILNATNSTLVVSNIQMTDSGKAYACKVTNPDGSVWSQSSTLTVLPISTPYVTAVLADAPVGYWRLDDASDSTIAADVWGCHDGVYINAAPGATGALVGDPDTAVSFGQTIAPSDVNSISGIDVSAPTNGDSSFSVEAWIQGTGYPQSSTAGIVTLGTWAAESFSLDLGGPGNTLRMFIRDAKGNNYQATSSLTLGDTTWHHAVGVVSLAQSSLSLYIDGILSSTVTIPSTNGIQTSSIPMTIGNRMAGDGSYGLNLQYFGQIDEVAVYKHALTAAQVASHYTATATAPIATLVPTNTVVNAGTTATFRAGAIGSAPLSYQWYDVTGGDPGTPVSGQTGANLVLNNVSAALNGTYYRVVVSNPNGSVTIPATVDGSGSFQPGAMLTVNSGAPTFAVDLPAQSGVYVGRTATLTVNVTGTAPFTYKWQFNGVDLADGGRISGSQTSTLTIANAQASDAGNYKVLVTNTGGTTPSTTCALSVQTRLSFNNGGGWTANGGAAFSGDVLTLTDGTGGAARSSFSQFPQFIGAFVASFTYQADLNNNGADGAAFVIQNAAAGASAIGGGGGNLAYAPDITNSVALELNLYIGNGQTPGWFFATNGTTPGGLGTFYKSTGEVDLKSGNPINVSLRYNGSTLDVTLKDSVTGGTYSTSIDGISIPAITKTNVAYVGFTGASGGVTAIQHVSNFSFASLPLITATRATGSSTVLTWPATIGGYVLQQSSSLTSPNWTTVTSPAIQVVNGQNQFTSSGQPGNNFYRLVLP